MLFDATIVPGAQRDRVYVQTDPPDRLDSGWQERLALSPHFRYGTRRGLGS